MLTGLLRNDIGEVKDKVGMGESGVDVVELAEPRALAAEPGVFRSNLQEAEAGDADSPRFPRAGVVVVAATAVVVVVVIVVVVLPVVDFRGGVTKVDVDSTLPTPPPPPGLAWTRAAPVTAAYVRKGDGGGGRGTTVSAPVADRYFSKGDCIVTLASAFSSSSSSTPPSVSIFHFRTTTGS